jgi:hypothetical protein
MILQYSRVSQVPKVFKMMTGLSVAEFDALAWDVVPQIVAAPGAHPRRTVRQRAVGGGHPFALSAQDQLLLTVVWLRHYLKQEALGYFFGVSDTTAKRAVDRVLPLLEAAGRDTMRLPDPGLKRRRDVDQLREAVPDLATLPEVTVVVDSFEQRVQRPTRRAEADLLYSGKKKMHTLKSQVAVHGPTGEIVDIAASARGPTADITVLKDSELPARLHPEVGLLGDQGYPGIAALHPHGCCPRRKPRGKPRPPEDVLYNQAFARQRIIVEHTIGRVRRFEALTQTDRHRRRHHTARVRAVGGLVNRHLRYQRRHLHAA